MKGRLLDRFAEADYRWHVVLLIQAAKDHIREHLPASVARLEKVTETGEPSLPRYRALIRVETLGWLPAAIAALGCEVEIERPVELRDRVKATAETMLRSAEAS